MNIYIISAIGRVQQEDQKAKVIFSYIVNWRLVLTRARACVRACVRVCVYMMSTVKVHQTQCKSATAQEPAGNLWPRE